MHYYFAPLEGITGYLYRNTHHAFFPGTDKYFMPFAAPNYTRNFKRKEKADMAPAITRWPRGRSSGAAARARRDEGRGCVRPEAMARSVSPLLEMTARSMQFSSSRTFPGQW